MRLPHRLPPGFVRACLRTGARPTRDALVVSTLEQRLYLFERPAVPARLAPDLGYHCRRRWVASTSRFGEGQVRDSFRTPLGLHRVAERIGAGWPPGAVFVGRKFRGYVWAGHAGAAIAHRILWLEGLESGFNRGHPVDSLARHIYIHGLADEPSLGRPASRGCVHLAAADLIPLFDRLRVGTLVWIQQAPLPRGAITRDPLPVRRETP